MNPLSYESVAGGIKTKRTRQKVAESPGAPASIEEPFMVESETVNAIRARAPLEALILDFMLVDGRAVITDLTPEQVRDGIKVRYEVDPYEVAGRLRASYDEALTVPYSAGVYSSADVAKVVAGRLIDAGLPVLVERLPEAPPNVQVTETAEGRPVHGHQGPVWVIRTGYRAPDTSARTREKKYQDNH